MKRRKPKYLIRLVSVVIMLLSLPLVVFFNWFWQKSFNEMEKGNEAYYDKVLDVFADNLRLKLAGLQEHAASIGAAGKDKKGVFWGGSGLFQESEYWYAEVVDELKNSFNDYDASGCYVYYYDVDCLFDSSGTRNLDTFTRKHLGIDDKEHKIWEYFDKENFSAGKIMFATTNAKNSCDGSLLLGYCTTMGKNQDPVLVFYVIEPDEYKDSLGIVYGNMGIHFYILNQESGEVFLALGDAAKSDFDFNQIEKEERLGGTTQKLWYQQEEGYYSLYFGMYVTEDSIQNVVGEFYQDMRILIVFAVSFLILISAVAIFVVYHPVYKLMVGLNDYNVELDDYNGDELASIGGALEKNYAKMQEQELLIMDLLLKHLVYGVPISKRRLERLGIAASIRFYCVFVLEGHILLSNEVEHITRILEQKFGARLFVTDSHEENRNVLILFLENSEIVSMQEWLKKWFDEHIKEEYKFYSGKVVDKLDDIRVSLLSCFEKEVNILNPKEEEQQKLKDEVLAYLELHYRDEDLSQTLVADEFKVSHYTLSRIFKNYVGVGFSEYVNAKRMEYAKELLLTTSYSVKEISAMVGFSSDNYFCKIFKATVGVSATVFREQ